MLRSLFRVERKARRRDAVIGVEVVEGRMLLSAAVLASPPGYVQLPIEVQAPAPPPGQGQPPPHVQLPIEVQAPATPAPAPATGSSIQIA
ncbi:MAG: hypothetical protein JO284_06440 [Planctomycetaceae bacterium]|nr:hypothetical protein [Planctomycetaceae bacterium]